MVQIHICEGPGDILVFLTGEEEIEDACKKIAKEIQQAGDSVSSSFGYTKAVAYLQTEPFWKPGGMLRVQHQFCRGWHTHGIALVHAAGGADQDLPLVFYFASTAAAAHL